jgi:hypothetical protein
MKHSLAMKHARRVTILLQIGIQLAALVWGAMAPPFAFAYDHPLTSDAVRQAYFLGQDLKGVNAYLAPYLKSLPVPSSGPDVAEIELKTPFVQVVEDSAMHSVNYSAQDAATAYQKRGDFMVVRVKILLTPTYTNTDANFWRDFAVGLIQGEHMAATGVAGEPIYSSDETGGGGLIGANIYARFSVAGVHSKPLQVEVAPPDRPPVHAKFDLSKLR